MKRITILLWERNTAQAEDETIPNKTSIQTFTRPRKKSQTFQEPRLHRPKNQVSLLVDLKYSTTMIESKFGGQGRYRLSISSRTDCRWRKATQEVQADGESAESEDTITCEESGCRNGDKGLDATGHAQIDNESWSHSHWTYLLILIWGGGFEN